MLESSFSRQVRRRGLEQFQMKVATPVLDLGITMTIEDTRGREIVTAAIAHLAASTPTTAHLPELLVNPLFAIVP